MILRYIKKIKGNFKELAMNKKTGFIILIAFSTVIASCSISKPYVSPEVNNDLLYRNEKATDSVSMALLPYTSVFTDTILQNLIQEGINNNPNLLTAFERINQAKAYYGQSAAALFPTLSANAGITVAKLSDLQGGNEKDPVVQYQLGIASNWEIDIWGKLNSIKRANLANLLQTTAGSRAVQTELVASIASYYYALLALDQQLLITQQTVHTWDTTVQTMRALKEAARVTEAAVVQSKAQGYAAEVTLPDLKLAIHETENSLSILLGRIPGPVNRSSIQSQHFPKEFNIGYPAALLKNRPDVQEAELNFRYYFEMTNAAKAYFYPALTLNGSASLTSLNPADLFNAGSLAASIAGGLFQPIFNQKANKTRLAIAESQQKAAILNFRNTVLNAGKEVSNALYLYEMANEKISIRSNQMDALEKSVLYTQELLRNGFATYTEVINARQLLLQAQLGSVNDYLQQLQSSVQLYKALGGGWR